MFLVCSTYLWNKPGICGSNHHPQSLHALATPTPKGRLASQRRGRGGPESPIGDMVYQVLIVPRARPPPRAGRRRKSAKTGRRTVAKTAKTARVAPAPPTTAAVACRHPPTMVRTLSRSTMSTSSSSSSEWSETSSVSSYGSRPSHCASPSPSDDALTARMQVLLDT